MSEPELIDGQIDLDGNIVQVEPPPPTYTVERLFEPAPTQLRGQTRMDQEATAP